MRKRWTKAGLTNLGKIIRESRIARNFSIDETVALIARTTGESVSARALGALETGNVDYPRYNTLEAIAAAEFVTDASGNILSIDDFINIASECYSMNQSLEFADMVAHAMQVNNISQSVLESAFADLEPGYFEIERLRQIQAKNGEPATIAERRFIVARVDPMNSVFHRLQWFGLDSEILAKSDNSNKHYTNQN